MRTWKDDERQRAALGALVESRGRQRLERVDFPKFRRARGLEECAGHKPLTLQRMLLQLAARRWVLGGTPNFRAYSRLNWLGLSYPTS